jgi:hypothetical protein
MRDLWLRLQLSLRYRVLPWHLPRSWRFLSIVGPCDADVARGEELAAEMGWGETLLGDSPVEPREGIVTAYDHAGRYVGCVGSETWAMLISDGTANSQSTTNERSSDA